MREVYSLIILGYVHLLRVTCMYISCPGLYHLKFISKKSKDHFPGLYVSNNPRSMMIILYTLWSMAGHVTLYGQHYAPTG